MEHAINSITALITKAIKIYFSEERGRFSKLMMFPVIWTLLNFGAFFYIFCPAKKEKQLNLEV